MQRLRRCRNVLTTQLVQGITRETTPAENHLVKDESKTVDVSASINLAAAVARDLAPLFRRHVIRSAEHLSRHRQRGVAAVVAGNLAHLRDTEIEQFAHRFPP